MNKRIGLFFLAVTLVLFQSVIFCESADFSGKLAEGIKYHDAARITPEGNIEKGKVLLSSIQDKSPIAKAYYGSIITLDASEHAKKKDVFRALALLNEGTGIIDAAVKQAPDVPDIRFLRMENSYEVSKSSPLNRYKTMKQDIDWLDSRQNIFDAKYRGIIDLYKGLYFARAKKIDEALAAFEACLAISPESPEAIESKKQIDKYAE